ncbi:MAG: class I SAM-dependent methyltransferase [Alphaproteobacteria bacterium]|nr:class I SAM-dependent methyltransferase [Alphaproteobacteria bacterium]
MLTQRIADYCFRNFERIESGTLSVTTPDGQTRVFGGRSDGDHARIDVRDWRVFPNMLQRGDVALADDYRSGLWESGDLIALTSLALRNRHAFGRITTGHNAFRTLSNVSYLMKINTLKGSRRNIHAHYDLGNDFYELWLDPTMTYSAALFEHKDTLEEAQNRKYDRIIDRLGRSSGRLIEIGCGWGGFAQRALSKGDFAIKGITLSEEQFGYATSRLGPAADIRLEDYRHQRGTYDHIVSIEMFEAVGERYWPLYFARLKDMLAKNGRAVVQTITMNERDYPRYRRGSDFIRSHIFPGGMLPSPSGFERAARNAGLAPRDRFDFGPHYGRTLELWLDNFDRRTGQVKGLGYDDGFIRLWRFYLAACAASFRTGHIGVMQVELAHA